MISYKEEYFKSFAKEKILSSLSFKTLINGLSTVSFYGPYQAKQEQGFVKDAKNVLDIISSIISKPQISIKNVDAIVRSEQASNLDNDSFLETLQDSSLWKRKDGIMTPESVHIKEATDTIVLYENIIVTRILDFINNELLGISRVYEKKIGNLYSYFETEAFTLNQFGVLGYLDKKTLPIKGILYSDKKTDSISLDSLTKLLKKCSTLMSTSFYKLNSTARLKRKEIVMTNILLKDRRYFNCYKFYKEYVSSRDESYLLPLYQDYVFLRLMNDLKDNYIYNELINDNLKITYDKGYQFSHPVYLQDKVFSYAIIKDKNDYGFTINLKLKKERDVKKISGDKIAKHYILLSLELNNENYKETMAKLEAKKNEGYSNITLITLRNNTHHYHNILTCSFYKDDDTIDGIRNLFSSYHLLFDCSFSTYEHVCPICGKRSVHHENEEYFCSSCKSNWTGITLNKKQYLWVKGLGGK